MAQLTITQLPQAGALTGTEAVAIVQNGVTVQTTTLAISDAADLNYPFLTVGTTSGLPDARYISVSSGLSLTDNGAGGTLVIGLVGTVPALNSNSSGIQVKTGINTMAARSIAVGNGLTVTNANGVAGNPTIGLSDFLTDLNNIGGTGFLGVQSGLLAKLSIVGTSEQIDVANGDGSANPVISIAPNPVLPGAQAVTIPTGLTSERPPMSTFGMIRANSTTGNLEAYVNSDWFPFTGSGISGASGISGYSGYSGFSGYSGLGLSGYSGKSGYSGLSGYSGNMGLSGFSGYSGSGVSGYSGFS